VRSLRRQLALGLLLAFSLLLGAGGVAVYFSIRSTLARQFDDALLARAVTMASCVKVDKGTIESHFSEHVAHGISAPNEVGFFEMWEIGGEVLNRSQSLGIALLPRTYSTSTRPQFFNLKLADGGEARGVGLRFTPDTENEQAGGEGDGDGDEGGSRKPERTESPEIPQIGLVVAVNCAHLDRALNGLVFIMVAAIVLMLGAAVFLVRLAVHRGLRPLDRLAEQTRQIGVGSLQLRFPADDLPEELLPICERLNALLARLELAFSEMSEYAGKVTHELRTPLAILRLKLEQAGGDIPPELAEEFQAQLQQLAHVVDQSLCIAKAEQGRLRLSPCPMDLADLVIDVAEDFSLLAGEQDRRVVFKRTGATLDITVDPKYTRQIVHNLLSNALKHGQGDIRIRLSGSPARCTLTILNRVAAEPAAARETLGLGLRVVDSLLQLQPEIKYRRRHGRHYYAVQMDFPRAGRQAGIPVPESVLPAA
jgi:signal transduction histidine kinase